MVRSALLAAVAALAVAAPASAHVQVTPAQAAPGDAVLFEVLVPNEREVATTGVSLQIPEGVLPFSFEETPGWTRRIEEADDGSTGVVRWSGAVDAGGFVRFAFLASTPDADGPIAWKAVQAYEDGQDVAWIGAPDSDEPAAVTEVGARFARANAGGEGAAATESGDAAASVQPIAVAAPDEGTDVLPLVLGGGGLALGAFALVVALRRRSV